jgi:hypothetical protein
MSASCIQKDASKFESDSTGNASSIWRLLTDALVVLNERQTDASGSQPHSPWLAD